MKFITIMRQKKSMLVELFYHILFWTVTLYFFCNHSRLRPSEMFLYKEVLSLLMLILMVYTNYFYLIPVLLQRGKPILYWSLALLFLVSIAFGEVFMHKALIRKVYSWLTPFEFNECLFWHSIMLFLRDSTFFLIFFLIRVYRDLTASYVLQKKEVSKQTQMLSLILPSKEVVWLKIEKILYIQHEQNYTYIYTIDGEKYVQYITLKSMEEILPQDSFLRINKNTLIMLHHVLCYDNYQVVLKDFGNRRMTTFFISSQKQQSIIAELRKRIPEQWRGTALNYSGADTCISVQDGGTEKLSNDEEIMNAEEKKLLLVIRQNPGFRIPAVAKAINKSERTAERYVKKLRELGKIEYRGLSGRTGGYYEVGS